MNQLFIEILTEEVPFLEHENQKRAISQFFLNNPELKGNLEVFSSRERLVIKLTNFETILVIPAKNLKGPSVTSDKKAINGFLQKAQTVKENLKEENGFFVFTTKEEKKNLKELLENGILINLFDFISRSFSKTMVWNETKKRWIRPIKSILTSINGEVINFEYAGVKAEKFTEFETPNCILNQEERLNKIKLEISKIEIEYSLKCVAREKLFNENSYLANLPSIKYDYFDTKYLTLPQKVLIQTLETNQKYFLFQNPDNTLSNLFAVCIEGEYSNEIAKQILEGNKKVLHSRLEDALYYLKMDTAHNLLHHLEKTKQVAFHKNAGTVFERVERMLKIAQDLNLTDANLELAIKLCKADLQTEMTQSFTELQGYIGAYYAGLEGYPQEVCNAILLQYKLGIEEKVEGKEILSLLLALIEKYEKIKTLLEAGEVPTSSRDPFGIRRDALAIIKILIEGKLNIKLTLNGELKEIIFDRLKFYLKGFNQDIINSVIKFEQQSTEFSLFDLYNKILTLSNHEKNFASFSRIVNILNSKEAKLFPFKELNFSLLTVEEAFMLTKFNNAQNMEDILNCASLIDKFFEHTLVIDEANEEMTQNKLVFLKAILNKIQKFICVL